MSRCIEVNYWNEQLQNWLISWDNNCNTCVQTHSCIIWRSKTTFKTLEDDHVLKQCPYIKILISSTDQGTASLELARITRVTNEERQMNTSVMTFLWAVPRFQLCKLWSWRRPLPNQTIKQYIKQRKHLQQDSNKGKFALLINLHYIFSSNIIFYDIKSAF